MSGYLIAGAVLALATTLPLAWKWQLSMFRAAFVTLAASMVGGVALTASDSLIHFTDVTGTLAMWGVTVLLCLAVLLVVFFRDPDRPAPSRDDVIASPADGRVIYVRLVPQGQVPVAEKKGRACPVPELSGTALVKDGAIAVG